MRVTIIICNYNYGHFVDRAIISAKEQSYNPLQICVVDAGSTDNSWDIINKSLFDGDFREFKHENNIISHVNLVNERKYLAIKLPEQCGPSKARNIAINSTWDETDIYAILDADDENYSDKIAKCVQVLNDPNIGLVYADYDTYNVDTEITNIEFKESYSQERLFQECIVHSGAVFKKDILAKAFDGSFYDENMRTCEDWELWLRMAPHCEMYHIAEPLSLVRIHNNNSTNSVHNDIWQKNWNYIRVKHAKKS